MRNKKQVSNERRKMESKVERKEGKEGKSRSGTRKETRKEHLGSKRKERQ